MVKRYGTGITFDVKLKTLLRRHTGNERNLKFGFNHFLQFLDVTGKKEIYNFLPFFLF